MENKRKFTLGGLIVLVAAIVVLGGLIYWATQGGRYSADSGEGSIISFELSEDSLIATSVGVDDIEVQYRSVGDNPHDEILGSMEEQKAKGSIQKWKLLLPNDPFLTQGVIATAFVDGEEIGSLPLSTEDLAKLRTRWFDVPMQDTVLSVGQTVTIDTLTATLVAVLEDSRCPANVNCIQAGQVRSQFEFTEAKNSKVIVMSTVGEGISFGNYFIEITDVVPQSVEAQTIPSGDYRVTLSISRDIKL